MPKPLADQIIKEDLGKPILTENSSSLKFENELYEKVDFEKNYNYFHIMGHEESHSIRRK